MVLSRRIFDNRPLFDERLSSRMAISNVTDHDPKIHRSVTLRCIGDWGQANWHRILSWVTQEFCDRTGPRSRTCIWSMRGGGLEAFELIDAGEADIAICTPAKLMTGCLDGTGIFTGHAPMPGLRTLARLPQNDRMMLAVDPSFGCRTFAEIREKKPPLKIATGVDDPSNFIGFCAHRYLEAHGLSKETIESWGGEIITSIRPEHSIIPAKYPETGITAVINEAIMAIWWNDIIDGLRGFLPIPAEHEALQLLQSKMLPSLPPSTLPAGWWKSLHSEIPALEFCDFLVLCREDLPEDIAYLLTWILVETKGVIEAQYRQFSPERSPLGWPMDPKLMAQTTIPLHAGARRYYLDKGHLTPGTSGLEGANK